jgi:hypothetical protein
MANLDNVLEFNAHLHVIVTAESPETSGRYRSTAQS